MINYDVPHDSEDYVHRIGRTARANNDGVAITFVSEKEQGNFKNIEKFLDRDIYKIPVPEELGEAPEYKPRAFDGGRRGGRGNGRKPGGNKNGRNNSKGVLSTARFAVRLTGTTGVPRGNGQIV